MATIAGLLQISETKLAKAISKIESGSVNGRFDEEIQISQTASLLAIARCLNHIIDHGIGPAPLQILSDEERNALKAKKERD